MHLKHLRQNSGAAFWFLLPAIVGLLCCCGIFWIEDPALEPDDIRYISQVRDLFSNPSLHWKNALIITNSWEDHWWVKSGSVSYLRPLPILSYIVDILLFGESARALILTNVVLFVALCLSVSALLRAIFPSAWITFPAALWFVTLPLHAEGIWYVAGRTDVLAWIFGSLFIRAHLLHQPPRYSYLWLFLALLCKEYALVLPIVVFFFDGGKAWHGVQGRRAEYLTYGVINLTYLVVRYLLLGGGGVHGTPLPLYFPVTSLSQSLYHGFLQCLYFLSVSVSGYFYPMYATAVSDGLALGAALSLPIAFWVIVSGVRSRAWRPSFLFLLLALGLTFPLYVSGRYLIGAGVAAACIVGACCESVALRQRGRWIGRIAVLISIWHALLLFLQLDIELKQHYRFASVARIRSAIEQVQDTLKDCDTLLVVDAPASQVYQMFLAEIFRVSLDRADIQTVVVSHAGEATHRKVVISKGVEGGVWWYELSSSEPLVTTQSADVALAVENTITPRSTSSGVHITVSNAGRDLHLTGRSQETRVCSAGFTYGQVIGLNIEPIS